MHTNETATAPLVTIIVKALNEERRIGACLQSALRELQGLDGEVLLVDSLSTDRTVEIAQQMAVRIVQFESRADRNCGAALQLGYQYARGQFIYVLDGDMTLEPGFIGHALAYLQRHADVAGVGGKLVDNQVLNVADKMRVAHYDALPPEQDVAVLGGGGLYRRCAIEQVGYLANRWLTAFEEAELGARLRAARWRLVRLATPAVTHSGHNETSFQLMMRLWRIGRIEASGVFLRGAVGRAWQGQAFKACWYVFAAPLLYGMAGTLAALATLAGAPFWPALGLALLAGWGGVLAALLWRKGDLHEALISLLAWHLYPVGAFKGFLRPPGDPAAPIRARVVRGG
jgi:cellulose synthase/poly-beta-1,6-N-acetylglucosamine synthase-like glycosyltransferase